MLSVVLLWGGLGAGVAVGADRSGLTASGRLQGSIYRNGESELWEAVAEWLVGRWLPLILSSTHAC